MAQAPILQEIERRNTVSAIIQNCLSHHRISVTVDANALHIRDKYILEVTSSNILSTHVLDYMFPHKELPVTLYHYTSFNGFSGILSTRELRLYAIQKRLGEGGELEAFAKKHRLQGYLDDSKGQPFYKELSKDLFYSAMTDSDTPQDPFLMWSVFAGGNGVRLKFRVAPVAAELRAIRYEAQGAPTLLEEINVALAAAGEPGFVPWTISKIGAFYLSCTVKAEGEVRLLMKRVEGAPERVRSDSTGSFWPIPIGSDNDVCRLDLLEIMVAPSGLIDEVQAAIVATAFSNVPVTRAV